MKKIITVMASAILTASAWAEGSISWNTLGNTIDENGKGQHIERFTVVPDGAEGFAFCIFKRAMTAVNPADTLREILPGYYAVMSPRMAQAAPGDTVVVDILLRAPLLHRSYRPDGMHLIADGKAVRCRTDFATGLDTPDQWRNGDKDGMIYGPQAFAINDSLRTAMRPQAYGGVPTLKHLTLSGERVKAPMSVVYKPVDDQRPGYVRLSLDGDPELTIYTNEPGAARHILRKIQKATAADGTIPAAEIEHWADYPYRGLMLDVARNYIPAAEVKRMLDLMADYGLNVLHFHLGEDEAWRVEIPGLPELTEVGSKRGYTLSDDVDFLKQIYSGDGNPEATDTPANGYYTAEEYMDLLRYADALGIEIIPEYDAPGHSRAAIRAMETRYRRTGDDSMRLIHDGDTSVYTSAQDYHDNVLNPALESSYRFWGAVMDGTKELYDRAGVPLRTIHIGGDEVPKHCWDGSSVAQEFMKSHGMENQSEMRAYFAGRLAHMAAERGIDIAGWQEIALDHSEAYNDSVRPNVRAVNCWTNAGDKGTRIAAAGYPLVITNVDYLYFDQTPTTHPEEPGLIWGGLVDEFKPLQATRSRLCKLSPETENNVYGISCTLFSETVRSPQMVQRYFLPRLVPMAERAHNAEATIGNEELFGFLTSEMPLWDSMGLDHILRQPGIRINADGMVEMNSAYAPGYGTIRYTLDGSDPTMESAAYTAPFKAADASQVRARLFAGPEARSVVSILFIK
ncbi:MAG: family 20 glycosylhydrolase [Muribaculaceae bacterium]|nr:family 20 glycosylhydrolase [Muribaculaceae bacterium]